MDDNKIQIIKCLEGWFQTRTATPSPARCSFCGRDLLIWLKVYDQIIGLECDCAERLFKLLIVPKFCEDEMMRIASSNGFKLYITDIKVKQIKFIKIIKH